MSMFLVDVQMGIFDRATRLRSVELCDQKARIWQYYCT